jgi:hypothetical protein
LSSIAQGDYTLVTPVAEPEPVDSPLTEIPANVPSRLGRALAGVAALLQAHEGAAAS